MKRLNIFEQKPPDYHPRLIGVVKVDAGKVQLDHGADELETFVKELQVTASGDGGEVKASDPDFHLAVIDSIGRQSNWHYTAEERE